MNANANRTHVYVHRTAHTAEVRVHIPALAPNVAARTAELGLPAARPAALADVRAAGAVQRWHALRIQVEAAERAVAEADAVVRRVEAARVLLESNPEPDLAAKLRAIEAELAASHERRAAAEADLKTVRHLIPRHYIAAAESAAMSANGSATKHLLSLSPAVEEAERELDAARERVAEVVARAVAEHLAPAVAKALAVTAAADWNASAPWMRDVVADAIGPPPAGVKLVNGKYVHDEPKPPTKD